MLASVAALRSAPPLASARLPLSPRSAAAAAAAARALESGILVRCVVDAPHGASRMRCADMAAAANPLPATRAPCGCCCESADDGFCGRGPM